MKNIRMRKISIRVAIGIILIFSAIIYWSPYGIKAKIKKRAVINSVLIDAPVEQVFDYLGKSKNASEWSVFVDEIIPVNSTDYMDGTVGSIRRCFADHKSIQWDEEIVDVIKLHSRELSIYNAYGFIMMADHLRTQQVFEQVSDDQTRLSLTLFFENEQEDFIDEVKMYFAAYEISRIFDLNLKNIKRFNEC